MDNLNQLTPSSDYEKTKKVLADYNASTVDPNRTHIFDQTNQSSLADIRKLFEKLSESGKIERDEHLGVVLDVKEEYDTDSKRIIKKVYVDIPGVNFEQIAHPDQFSSQQIDLTKLEHKAFYPLSEKLFDTDYPHYNDIVRVKVPNNYFNSYVYNRYDKKYLGIALKSTSIIPSTDQAVIPKANPALQLKKDKEKDPSFGNTGKAAEIVPKIGKKDPTNKKIATLDYRFQSVIQNFVSQARAAGYNIVIVDGSRSIIEQAKVYSQGRTTPGPIVSNAPAGSSAHNFGLGIDFAFADESGRPIWPNDAPWKEVGQIGKSLGLVWGGEFKGKFKDLPHLESPNWQSAKAKWVASGQEEYIIATTPTNKINNAVAANTNEKQTGVNATTQNSPSNKSGTNASSPTNRPKLLLVDFNVDQSTGIRTTANVGSKKIKIREDIASDLTKIKEKLNQYNIPLTCNSYDIKLDNDYVTLLGKVGLEIRLNKFSALTAENDLEIDDYFVGPDYNKPLGNGYSLIVYGNVKRNIKYFDEVYTPEKQIIDVYDVKNTEKGKLKTKKILKNVINMTKMFQNFGFISIPPSQDFFIYGDSDKSNWNVFQKPAKIIVGYSYKELLSTVYYNRGEPIWRLPDLKWDGNKFI